MSNQLESHYEKEALAVSGVGHPPSHYNASGDLEDRCVSMIISTAVVCFPLSEQTDRTGCRALVTDGLLVGAAKHVV